MTWQANEMKAQVERLNRRLTIPNPSLGFALKIETMYFDFFQFLIWFSLVRYNVSFIFS